MRIALVLLALTPTLGLAQEGTTVAQVRDKCVLVDALSEGRISTSDAYADAHYCLGFMVSAGQHLAMMGDKKYACPPDSVTVGQQARVFVKWADARPEQQHLPAYFGIRASLREAFPCP